MLGGEGGNETPSLTSSSMECQVQGQPSLHLNPQPLTLALLITRLADVKQIRLTFSSIYEAFSYKTLGRPLTS